MNDLMVASTEADARAAEAIVAHHAAMDGTLRTHVARLESAVRTGRREDVERARAELVAWCRTDLVPHALAEEATLYPAASARPAAALLISSMLAEHQQLLDLVTRLERAEAGVDAAVAAGSVLTLFESHLAKENELVVPLLATASDVSLAELLDGMHEELDHGDHHADHGDHADHADHDHADHHHGAAAAPAGHGHGHGHGGCGCGESDPAGYPELDVRTIPHAIRHATVFGAVDGVRPGSGLVLVAPHDPLPLLAQLEQRDPGVLSVEYLERGPEAWKLQILRAAR